MIHARSLSGRRRLTLALAVALALLVSGLPGAAAADPTVPPSAPTVTATHQGSPLENCVDKPSCPGVVVRGDTVTFTFTANSPDVVAFEYFDNGNGHPPVEGSTVSVDVVVGTGSLLLVDVQAINEIGQRSVTTHFRVGTTRAPGPIGSWAFDDGSGTTAADGPGLTHPLTLSGGASFEAGGRVAGAMALDGLDDAAAATDAVLDTSKSFSISAWARPTSSSKLGIVAAVNGTNSSSAGLGFDPSSRRWIFGRTSADVRTPSLFKVSSREAPVYGAWSHLLATYDASSGQLELFVNGRLQQSASMSVADAWKATGALTVGRGQLGGTAGGYFAGSVDSVQVWQRVLRSYEILAAPTPRNSFGAPLMGDVTYWPLDTATRGSDRVWRSPETLRAADLTVSGFQDSDQSKAFVDDPERGKVLALSGSSRESVTVDRALVDASTSFTVAAMVNVSDPTKPGVVIRQGTTTKDNWRLAYEPVDAQTGQFTFSRTNAGSTTETTAAVTRSIEYGELTGWHLVVATYEVSDRDPADDNISVTVDLRGGASERFIAPRRDGSTTIGKPGPTGTPLTGRVDDIRLYTGTMAATKICTDYPGQRACGS